MIFTGGKGMFSRILKCLSWVIIASAFDQNT